MNGSPTHLVPVLALRNLVVFPQTTQQVRVGREKSLKALQKAMEQNNWIFLVLQKNPNESIQGPADLQKVGTLCRIEHVKGTEESGYNVLIRGHSRMHVVSWDETQNFLTAQLEPYTDIVELDKSTEVALLNSLKKMCEEILNLVPGNVKSLQEMVGGIDDLTLLTHLICQHVDFKLTEKQKFLEILSVKDRSMALLTALQSLRENLKIRQDIQDKLASSLTENQRQHILREQMKTIKEELGEDDVQKNDYRTRIAEAGMSEEAKSLALQQVERLEGMSPQSPEYSMIKNHLDFMLALPWKPSDDVQEIDLESARKILNTDHYGMEKIKKRVIQSLAVMKLKKSAKGTVLLFVGPPGVGKTSLAQSIASALGKSYVRVSVGGVRDDAEVRGHRRTYIGALPGRILAGMKKANRIDPVFVLDEIDKLSRGYSGDPASALLEVLDPEQNAHFLDHYLDVGYDLSKVFFICTANSLDGIPAPLLDRMEIIELSSYTSSEKFQIAKRHLIPRKFKEYGVEVGKFQIHDDVVQKIISHYTREAGVRELDRKLDTIFRASSEKIIELGPQENLVISRDTAVEILGHEKYHQEVADVASHPGVVTGLAWTPVGGDILFVESIVVKGEGKLLITGQLGDVMKESAQIAMTLLKSRLPLIDPTYDFGKKDVHVHLPAGAIPKDGPSAGVTLLTSIASLLLDRSVDPKLAMTGEITLRGVVMPVGGIKEKVIAAHRAGIEKIILPIKNRKDLSEIPEEIKQSLRFYFVEDIDEVLKIALAAEVQLIPSNSVSPTSSFVNETLRS